ncbi:2-amino-4-hydroxy-6-hydroxymethyldihydropteridine diphosphokinase [Peptoniphilus catoniae]|uniref:2-amino-4-hydroxy-6- hydroxymethyldihydropteridine diphosphokinase n=1 Tax=Peptoniphilus catoniae TaxID=1660341 RepID=UPI0010FF2D20|nr:2-amino-4-hydroxy-6-hydroxymethyldihydropteridine diphosphokinase [Peptoniphilus catoniae]
MDCLKIKDLEIYANHGVFKEEKTLGQKFLISADIFYSFTSAALGDRLEYSIDYGKLCKDITKRFKERSFDLIETSCLDIIKFIFDSYQEVKRVDLEVKKPWAPIGLPLNSASVKMTRRRRDFYIGLGTNMGDKEKNLKEAISLMEEKGIKIRKSSGLLGNKAWGKTDQADFLNQIVIASSYEEPEDLLKILNDIEEEMGRKRIEKWGPRIIDLDILFVDYEIIYTDKLIVPHPYIQYRDFILQQLYEIAPHFIHPVLNKSISVLYEEVKNKNSEIKYL